LEKHGIKPGLDRISHLLELLGDPQNKIKIIHVAGTNGKGSVCHMLSAILISSGLRTGLFTSPHLVDIRERFKINGIEIECEYFVKILEKILYLIEKNNILITQFELFTAVAFEFFNEEKVDVAIIETGMGGTLDSTNISKSPLVCVITSISYDHTEFLGESIQKIAIEKAGIIKRNIPIILFSIQEEAVFKVVKERCKQLSCELTVPKMSDVKLCGPGNIKNKFEIFEYKNQKFKVPLFGEHQAANLATTLSVVEILKNTFKINNCSIKDGLKSIKLHARFELICRNPIIILDGAHNVGGAKTLANCLKRYLNNKEVVAILGVMKDKDVIGILSEISHLFKKVITVTPKNKRSMHAEELAKIVEKFNKNVIYDNTQHVLSQIIKEKSQSYVIFGSLYLAGEVLEYYSSKSAFNQK
jgi:dihydrofolate synthase/folylpolyglutamate synthase